MVSYCGCPSSMMTQHNHRRPIFRRFVVVGLTKACGRQESRWDPCGLLTRGEIKNFYTGILDLIKEMEVLWILKK